MHGVARTAMKCFNVTGGLVTLLTLFAACDALATAPSPVPAPPDPGYTAYTEGSNVDAVTVPLGGAYLAGGGTDIDAGMVWLMIQGGARGANQYGDVVVLRTTGGDGYNRYLADLGANSVTSVVIKSVAGANSAYVQNAIARAEAIFIAGGDQSTYVNLWTGTALVAAVNARIAQGYPIGGTSAGLAVLGDYVYAALNASSVSATVMANPYDASVTLQSALFNVPVLRNVLTDSHFKARDRMGRLMTFMARLQQDGLATPSLPLAIGVDEQSGVGVSMNKSAVVFGPGAGVFLLNATPSSVRLCLTGVPLTFTNIATQRVSTGQTFSLATFTGPATTSYTLSIHLGVLTSSTSSIY